MLSERHSAAKSYRSSTWGSNRHRNSECGAVPRQRSPTEAKPTQVGTITQRRSQRGHKYSNQSQLDTAQATHRRSKTTRRRESCSAPMTQINRYSPRGAGTAALGVPTTQQSMALQQTSNNSRVSADGTGQGDTQQTSNSVRLKVPSTNRIDNHAPVAHSRGKAANAENAKPHSRKRERQDTRKRERQDTRKRERQDKDTPRKRERQDKDTPSPTEAEASALRWRIPTSRSPSASKWGRARPEADSNLDTPSGYHCFSRESARGGRSGMHKQQSKATAL